jgi:hypothetical protein
MSTPSGTLVSTGDGRWIVARMFGHGRRTQFWNNGGR